MRRIWAFEGGVHPPENKQQSLNGPIRKAGIPDQLVLPFQQHIGGPARPVVSVGDRVLKGQLLAEASGAISAGIHAPTSGHIIDISDQRIPHPSGTTGPCMVLKPDGEDEWRERRPELDLSQLEPEAFVAHIREAGICGLGGAGFPTEVKLATGDRAVETLILNGAECEPFITADHSLMRERAFEVVEGIRVIGHLLQPAEVLIGIEDNKPDAIEAMREACEGLPYEVVVIPTKYPSGGEKQLIQILTGKEVPYGGIPLDLGIVCQNVGTAAAIYRALKKDEPLISRITTVTGEGVRNPGNYEVLLGTPIRFLLEQAGFDPATAHRVVMGGPMMGFELPSLEAPVIKTTNCILAAGDSEFPDPDAEQACIRCGYCAEACPAQLLPQQLYWFARSDQFDKAELYHLSDCIECGACAYVCPSSIPLVQYYRYAKGKITQQRADTLKSDRARERFEARQQRLEREAAEKEAKRRARAEAAAAAQKAKAAAAEKDKPET